MSGSHSGIPWALLGLGFIKLEIPTLAPEPPTGEGWIHEIKYGGYRPLVVIDHGQVRAFTRNGNDWTRAYRRVVEACARLARESALIETVKPLFPLRLIFGASATTWGPMARSLSKTSMALPISMRCARPFIPRRSGSS